MTSNTGADLVFSEATTGASANDDREAVQPRGCEPAARVTKSLLGYGVLAGPVYVVVALTQALTRTGFDLTRHEWSLLANGHHGWIQIVNFLVTGLMVIAFATGLRRALVTGVAAVWGPRLLMVYGLSLVAAGCFRADPTLGFPAGTPSGRGVVSWHGVLHFVAGGIGFSCLAIACFVVANRYAREGRRGWAIGSRLTAFAFLAGFASVASGWDSAIAVLGFTAGVILVWAWIAAVAVDRYRQVAGSSRPASMAPNSGISTEGI